jgi:hypothetical protein
MDGSAQPSVPTPVSEMTPEAADAEIAATNADPSLPYWSNNHPGKDAAKERMTALYEIAEGATGQAAGEPAPAYQDDPNTGISQTSDFDKQAEDLMAPADSPEAYDFDELKIQMGDDGNWDVEMEDKARGWFHTLGLSEAEGTAALKTYAEVIGYDDDQANQLRMSTQTVLDNKYGADLPAHLQAATGVARAAGGDELIQFLEDTGLGLNGPVIERLIRAAKETNR